jgi:drug/metabolite transporter (DMT)-like permease
MRLSPRYLAILKALFVTLLWSSSWVLIKNSLNEIPPLTFAGLRYTLAFLILLPGLWKYRSEVRHLHRQEWVRLVILGLVFYTLTQGGQFLSLLYLEATSFSLILNFTTLIVAIIGTFALNEIPSRGQWGGVAVFLLGVILFFSTATKLGGEPLGYLFAGITVVANATAAVLGRAINREAKLPTLMVTVISMGSGAILLLAMGILLEGFAIISPSGWAVIIWLAIVNTALAFNMWNKTLEILTAVESSIINSTMLIQISLLAVFFLDEHLGVQNVLGLVVASAGILMVNLWPPKQR